MKTAYLAAAGALAIIILGAAGCASSGGGTQSDLSSYLPMAVGNTWTYDLRIRADMDPMQEHPGWNLFTETHEITGTAQLQGTDYFVFRIVRQATPDFPEKVDTQFRRTDHNGVYARDWDNGMDFTMLRTPPHAGDTWSDTVYPNITYQTIATDEVVTVPAGTFHCVRVRMEDADARSDNGDYQFLRVESWFARGVGLVKDETWEQRVSTEEWEMLSDLQLRDYQLL